MAVTAHMTRAIIRTETFAIASYARIGDPAQPLNVYIEGDGLAWLSKSQPSADPTPRHPTALMLAVHDPAPNVVYLARPCQFTGRENDTLCKPAYWGGARFANEVIVAADQAVNHHLSQMRAPSIHLFGYSGGGAVAALLAARRSDVASLTTIAGNLDTGLFTRIHDVTPLSGSLNPLSIATRIAAVPQRHFVGSADDVIPAAIANSFVVASRDTHCIRTIVVAGVTHDSGWSERWPALLQEPFNCGGAPHGSRQ